MIAMPHGKKILMLSFELPPHNSGGLGVACLGITKALASKGYKIIFMLPNRLEYPYTHMKIVFSDDFKLKNHQLPKSYFKKNSNICNKTPSGYMYGLADVNLKSTMNTLTQNMLTASRSEDFDIIHAHDWMTFEAGLNIKKDSKRPLVVHIHSTEIDRSPPFYIDRYKFHIEKKGMEGADAVIAVSNHTKKIIHKYYGIPLKKIFVMYNAAEVENNNALLPAIKLKSPLVVFLGRITHQKGPLFFLETAQKVLSKDPSVIFVVAGSGDMYETMIEKSCEYGLTGSVVFTNFLRGAYKDSILHHADVFVMPSISEPFGIVALEAAHFDTPVIVSKQSGVGEILRSSIKIDFWDTDLLAKKINYLLKNKLRRERLVKKHKRELNKITWSTTTQSLCNLYNKLIRSE